MAVLAGEDAAAFQSLLHACAENTVRAQLVLVVTCTRLSRALDLAEAAGIPTLYHPFDWYEATGRTRSDYDSDLADAVLRAAPDTVLLLNWQPVPGPAFHARWSGGIFNSLDSLQTLT